MRNESSWKANRILYNRDRDEYRPNMAVVYPGSLHIAKLQLKAYRTVIETYCTGDLLDCGCGSMPYYQMYKGKTSSITGVDWEGTHGENAFADKIADLNEGIPFDDGSFDSVLVTDVLAHIFQPENLIKDISRVLRPDGKLVLTSPFFYWISEPPHEYYRYTEYALRRFCEQAGLEVVHLDAYGGRADIFLDLLNKKMVGKISNRIFSLLSRMMGTGGGQKRRMAKTKNKFPLGYTLVARKTVG